MTTERPSVLGRLTTSDLNAVLRVNAGFSAASASLLLFGSGALAGWLDVSRSIVLVAGLGIAAFAVYVAWVALQRPLRATHLRTIAVADLSWVLAAAIVVAVPGTMSPVGKVALALVSLVVLDLGIAEWIGQRRLAADRRRIAVS